MKILLLNAGSSSLKCSLMDSATNEVLARATAEWAGDVTHYAYASGSSETQRDAASWRGHAEAVRRIVHDLQHAAPIALPAKTDLAAVGHRVVQGGPFDVAVRITAEIRERIESLVELAPLHNPPTLAALAAAQAELPCVPHVAVFDTAFHATLPPEAKTYAVPQSWTQDWGIRRYGFHGLSHAYCAQRAAEMLAQPADALRLVICHLGHGCSATAVKAGRSIDTTMGFTPLEGLMMATRSGSIDPGVLLYVQQQHGLTPPQLENTLNKQSGLLGVSGLSADMRQLLAAARDGHPPAKLALDIYTHRVRQAIGALAVTMGGVDALVFTAGVGEHASEIRAQICVGLECLGLELSASANDSLQPDADVATPESRGRILVIATREDVTMLQEVARVACA